MKDVISVDRILISLYLGDGFIDSVPNWKTQMENDKLAESKRLLHSLLISKLPEKSTHKPSDAAHYNPPECCIRTEGYNSAIDDIRKSIDEMFDLTSGGK